MFLNKLRALLSSCSLTDEKLMIAFSGGSDSTALVFALNRLKDELKIKLFPCHVNHGLRENEADNDEKFCAHFCDSLNLPFSVVRLNMTDNGTSSYEAKARHLRYEALEKEALKLNIPAIATAHNMNDQAETFLIRLLRGSGSKGLASIHREVKGKVRIIRPFLDFTKEEINKFIKQNDLPYCRDLSNNDRRFTRSRIRHDTLPDLKGKYNPRLIEQLAQTADIVREDHIYLEEKARQYFNELSSISKSKVIIDVRKFGNLHICLKRRVARLASERIKGNLLKITASHIDNIIALSDGKERAKEISLPDGLTVRKEYNELVFSKEEKEKTARWNYSLSLPGQVKVEEYGSVFKASFFDSNDMTIDGIKKMSHMENRIFVDADRAGKILQIRNRRKGDTIRLLGCKGRKKLKDIFIDNKISSAKRQRTPVILRNNEIIWVCGCALSDLFRITDRTTRILEIKRENIC